MLTQEQKDFFETFGFLLFKSCLSAAETEKLSSAFDRTLLKDRVGRDFPGDRRQSVFGFVEKDPELTGLLADDRIYGPIEQLMGDRFTWLVSEANIFVGDTLWHPDTHGDFFKIKAALYLDPVRKESGCLRVIPGSHHEPFHSLLKHTVRGKSPEFQREAPCLPLETDPGDLVMFHQKVWHSTFGGLAGRRMIALNFCEYPDTQGKIDAYTQEYRNVEQLIAQLHYTPHSRVYDDTFLYSDNPRIRSMAAKLAELGFR